MAVAQRKIRIHAVRREPVDLDRMAAALLALAQQLVDENEVSNTDVNENEVVPTDVNSKVTVDEGVDVDTDSTDPFNDEKGDEAST